MDFGKQTSLSFFGELEVIGLDIGFVPVPSVVLFSYMILLRDSEVCCCGSTEEQSATDGSMRNEECTARII